MGIEIYANSALAGLGPTAVWPTMAQHATAVMRAALEEGPPAAAVALAQLERGFARRMGPEGAVYDEKILAGSPNSNGGVATPAPKRSIGLYERVDPESKRRALEVLMEFERRRDNLFNAASFFGGIALCDLAEMLRRDLPVPTVVLTNTGADPFRMALSLESLLKGIRGKVSFPLSINDVPQHMEALPQQLKTFAILRKRPNLTVEIRCSVIDLICWMAENPSSWNEGGNYIVSSLDIFRFGVEKGILRFTALPGCDAGKKAAVFDQLQLAIQRLGAELVFAEGENFWDVLNGREDDEYVERSAKEWAASMTKDLAGEWKKILEKTRIAVEGEILRNKGISRGDVNPFMATICRRLGVPAEFGDFIFYDFSPELQNQIREFLSRK